MDLTKEDWSEWKAHPCTKAACKDVEEKISDVKDSLEDVMAHDTTEKVAMAVVYKLGLIDGARALLEVTEDHTDED